MIKKVIEQTKRVASPERRQKKKTQNLLGFVIALGLPLLAGGLGAIATRRSLSGWYRRLKKPRWNPPDWVFGPVWTILYLFMGIASWLVWQKRDTQKTEVREGLKWYGIQLGLNSLWSIIFFGLRRIDLALLEIIALESAVSFTVTRFFNVHKKAGWLMVPYALWVGFATILNSAIWWLNLEEESGFSSLMSKAKRALAYLGHHTERNFDRIKFGLKQRLGRLDPVRIYPYRGYGTSQKIYIKGRVLEDEGLPPATISDTLWRNLWSMYKRFETDEIPNVRLEARFQNVRQEVVTDAEGYFSVEFEPAGTLASEHVWHPIELRLLEQVVPEQELVEATGQVLVPPVQSDFGIISDVDDTIIETEVTDFLKMLRVIFFNNAKTRLPFKGVAGFYRALCRGLGNHPSHNPIFYVSGSPWNLYDLLIDFMQTQQIPLGPLFLRDFGLSMDKFIKRSTKLHKLEQIEHILTLYPDLPFILIGDSGEKDPEIYQQVVQDFPGRILAIYIREISLEGRQAEIDLLIEELGKQDVEMVLVPDTEVAALHAVDRGFISRESLSDIQTEKSKDETAPSDLEQLLEQV